jgi:hypothetical protein
MTIVATVPGNCVLLIGPNFDKCYRFNEVGGASYSFALALPLRTSLLEGRIYSFWCSGAIKMWRLLSVKTNVGLVVVFFFFSYDNKKIRSNFA